MNYRKPSDIRTLVGYITEIRSEGLPYDARNFRYKPSEIGILIASHRRQVEQCEVTIESLRQRLKDNVEPPVQEELERDLQRYEAEKQRCEIFLKALTTPGPPRSSPGSDWLRPFEDENVRFRRLLPNIPNRLELLSEGSNRLRFPQQPDETEPELYRDALSAARLIGDDLRDHLVNSRFSVRDLARALLDVCTFDIKNLEGSAIVAFRWADQQVSLNQFRNEHQKGHYVIKMPGHVFVVIDGRVYDQYPERAKERDIVGAWEIMIGS